jgi:hypothetical protein
LALRQRDLIVNSANAMRPAFNPEEPDVPTQRTAIVSLGNKPPPATTEAQARVAGFTREVVASSLGQDLNLLIEPETDLDGRFHAFDLDTLTMVCVSGWLGVFEDV